MIPTQLRCLLRLLGLLLLLNVSYLGLSGITYAETGSAQSTMSLIVLPNENNAPTLHNAAGKNTAYDSDTLVSELKKSGNQAYRVWVSI